MSTEEQQLSDGLELNGGTYEQWAHDEVLRRCRETPIGGNSMDVKVSVSTTETYDLAWLLDSIYTHNLLDSDFLDEVRQEMEKTHSKGYEGCNEKLYDPEGKVIGTIKLKVTP